MVLTTNNIEYNPLKLEIMDRLCRASKDLYNFSLYQVRQHFFKEKTYLNHPSNYKLIKDLENDEGEKPYYFLPTNASQQTIKSVDSAFKSFFALLNKKNKGEYDEAVHLPKYLDKEGKYKVVFTKIHIRIREGYVLLTLPKYLKEEYDFTSLNFKIPKHIPAEEIQEIHFVPKGKKIELSWIRKNDDELEELHSNNIMSIDLGINNFASILTLNEKPILISGLKAKSVNSYFNYQVSKIKRQIDLTKNNNKNYTHLVKRESTLWEKRNQFIKDFTHKTADKIIEIAFKTQVHLIVIGFNKEWKTEVNMGRKNNKNFYGLPHSKLIDYIKYRAKLLGIKVVLQEESYTSKCDSLAKEFPQKYSRYSGCRKKRGLFQSSIGKWINADVNGCINILVKYLNKNKQDSSSIIDGILSKGLVFNPIRVQVS